MTTDYKIGIVVGLGVLIVGVLYFLINPGRETAPPTETPPGQAEPSDVLIKDGVDATAEAPAPPVGIAPVPDKAADTGKKSAADSDSAVTPRLAQADKVDTVDTVDKMPPAVTDDGWQLDEEPADDDTTTIKTVPTPPTAGTGTETTTPPAATARDDEGRFQLNPDADLALKEPDPVIATVHQPKKVKVKGNTYTVRRGDVGFWYIAEKVYGPGNGKHWPAIRDANPTADTNALRPGQVLIIPPLAEKVTTTRKQPAATGPYGKTTTDTTGRKIYVVSRGDSAGLWGIAAKPEVYGKGYLWRHIQKANPDVNPYELKPGMKLIIPPLPPRAVRVDRASPAPAERGKTFARGGKKYYIVKSGDAGFWGIAKKEYGNGKYAYLIERANPGVDSEALKPGDKLYLPPRPTGTTTPRRPAGRTAPPPAPPTRGEPDFGP